MSKIHVLESNNDFAYKVVIHFPIPTGNNSVGLTWKLCGLSSKKTGSTILEVGTGPGNITQLEYDNIINGDIVEIIRSINPGMNPTNMAVEALCNIYILNWLADNSRILKYYGHTIEEE